MRVNEAFGIYEQKMIELSEAHKEEARCLEKLASSCWEVYDNCKEVSKYLDRYVDSWQSPKTKE